jgi:hypothetical protein
MPDRPPSRVHSLPSSFAAALLTGLLAVGCGASVRSHTGSPADASSFANSFLAFAGCMRSHGLPSYPDPQISTSGGEVKVRISPGGLDPSAPAFSSADRACHHLLPDGGAPSPGGAQQHAQGLKFATCMRAHGVPNFPDPDRDGAFTLPPTINPQAPQVQGALRTCRPVAPSSLTLHQSPPAA